MLKNYLIAKTSPQAHLGNIVLWENYRVTVLGERLFRLEQSDRGIFRDKATQAVWFRDMPKQNFTVDDNERTAIIDTGACKLILKKERAQVCVELNGVTVRADNYGNLLGTYRTLDNCDGDIAKRHWRPDDPEVKIELGKGVCSKTGVAVLDDSASLSLGFDGFVENEKADGTDEYIFAFGDDYRGAVRALYDITGYTPLVPRFALGNWWSRYHIYTDKEYLRVLSAFEEREIPLSVATVDMDWHWSTEVDKQKKIQEQGKRTAEFVGDSLINLGWTGYSWNTELFPNPQEFLKKIKEKGLKITLNLHPADGIRFWEDCYDEMATALGMDASEQKHIPFDFSYEGFIQPYFDIIHRPHEKDGVDFWWMDWQQPKIAWHGRREKTYDPLWALNHYHYLDNTDGRETPLLLSRYAGVGSHRYPLGFSGDTKITWKTLAYLPYFTATASNIGYTWWSHDIGGHMVGEKSDELYLRHVQYGVFSPINRLHCSREDTMTKEPWLYGVEGEQAVQFLRFRHSLIPYLYTASYLTHKQGVPLTEPIYYAWNTPNAFAHKEEYLFGSQLLVAPVTSKGYPDGFARVRAWLPEGEWTDIFTGDRYEIGAGGKEIVFLRGKESIPVLAKAGGILPLSMDKGNAYDNPEKLEIWSYEGNGEYTLYEDGKEQGKEGTFFTEFTSELCETEGVCTQVLTIKGTGEASVIPQNRQLAVRFKDIEDGEVTVYADGQRLEMEEWLTSCAGAKFSFQPNTAYRVEVRYKKQTKLDRLKARAKTVLTRAEWENKPKYELYLKLIVAVRVEHYVSIVEESTLPDIIKMRLLETV